MQLEHAKTRPAAAASYDIQIHEATEVFTVRDTGIFLTEGSVYTLERSSVCCLSGKWSDRVSAWHMTDCRLDTRDSSVSLSDFDLTSCVDVLVI